MVNASWKTSGLVFCLTKMLTKILTRIYLKYPIFKRASHKTDDLLLIEIRQKKNGSLWWRCVLNNLNTFLDACAHKIKHVLGLILVLFY